MEEFKTIVAVAKEVISGASAPGVPAADLVVRRIDEGGLDGDLCAVVSTPDRSVTAVVWPTAEKLPLLKQLEADAAVGTLLVVNPLWKAEGNLVSEFGILPWDRKANEEFVAKFSPSYYLNEQRVGAPSSINMASGRRYDSGAILRVLRVHGGPFTAHVMAADGASQAIGGTEGARPTYKELEALIKTSRQNNLEIFDVAKRASSLDIEMGKAGRAGGGADGGDDGGGAEALAASFPSLEELAALEADPKTVRRLLVSLGLPGSGTPAKLQARAVAVAEALARGETLQQAVKAALKLR